MSRKPSRDSKICRRFSKGDSLDKIANQFGLSRIRVYKIVVRAGYSVK